MKKLPVNLIALDLDDTLLNDDRQITDLNVKALRECVQKGIYVVLCSGRAEDAILPFVRRLEIAGKDLMQNEYTMRLYEATSRNFGPLRDIDTIRVFSDLL